MISKDDLLNKQLDTRIVNIDGDEFLIKEFTTSDREDFEILAMKMQSTVQPKNMKAKLIVISLINEDRTRMFGDDEIGTVSQLPSKITQKLFDEILSLNGMAEDSIEDTIKN